MPNTLPAAGEAMPKINRRKALALFAAASFIPAVAVAAEPSRLTTLIEAHRAALELDKAAWEDVSDFYDSPAGIVTPRVRVQVGRLLVGQDDNRENIYEPIFAYDEAEVREHFSRHMIWPSTRDALSAQLQQKLNELREIEAEVQRINDGSGLTAVMEIARATAARVKAFEAEIMAFVPTTLSEAIELARWTLWAYDYDYTYVRDHDSSECALLAVLGAIAKGA